MASVTIDPSGKYLSLTSSSGHRRFHAIWLRDNASDHQTRAPENGQRLIALRDIPHDTSITKTNLNGDTLDVSFAPEDKVVRFDISWLEEHAYDEAPSRSRGCFSAVRAAAAAAALHRTQSARARRARGGLPSCHPLSGCLVALAESPM